MMTAHINKRNILVVLLFCLSFFSAQLVGQQIDPSSDIGWDQIPGSEKQKLIQAAAQGYQAYADSLTDVMNEHPMFAADAIHSLYLQGKEDVFERLLSPWDEPMQDVVQYLVDILLMENRISPALDALHIAYQSSGHRSYLMKIAELHFSLGDVESARGELRNFLSASSIPRSEYVRAMYLLSRILLRDGQESAVASLLIDRLQLADLRSEQDNYYFLANLSLLVSLESILRSSELTDERREKLDAFRQFFNQQNFNIAEDGHAFPGLQILDAHELSRSEREDIGVSSADSVGTNANEPIQLSRTDTSDSDAANPENQASQLIQLGSFSSNSNAQQRAQRILSEFGFPAFVYQIDGSYKVFLDAQDSSFTDTENYGNPRRILLVLKEQGLEGFLVSDPR